MFGKKKSTKKGVGLLKQQEKHISGAIRDLNRELKTLSRQKSEFEKDLGANKAKVKILQNKENRLKNSILKLVEKKERINQKRRNIFSKINRVKKKMRQVNKIKDKIKSI